MKIEAVGVILASSLILLVASFFGCDERHSYDPAPYGSWC